MFWLGIIDVVCGNLIVAFCISIVCLCYWLLCLFAVLLLLCLGIGDSIVFLVWFAAFLLVCGYLLIVDL